MSRWVRLWEDMPTDPKWRVVSRRSGRPLVEVVAVFVMMMTTADAASGTLDAWDDEDAGAALDMDAEMVRAIREAMQGKTLDGDTLLSFRKLIPACAARPPANEWGNLRRSIFERDGFTCSYCGQRGGQLECDHIIPIARGGSSNPENLTTACFSCNRSKRDKLLSEWRAN